MKKNSIAFLAFFAIGLALGARQARELTSRFGAQVTDVSTKSKPLQGPPLIGAESEKRGADVTASTSQIEAQKKNEIWRASLERIPLIHLRSALEQGMNKWLRGRDEMIAERFALPEDQQQRDLQAEALFALYRDPIQKNSWFRSKFSIQDSAKRSWDLFFFAGFETGPVPMNLGASDDESTMTGLQPFNSDSTLIRIYLILQGEGRFFETAMSRSLGALSSDDGKYFTPISESFLEREIGVSVLASEIPSPSGRDGDLQIRYLNNKNWKVKNSVLRWEEITEEEKNLALEMHRSQREK